MGIRILEEAACEPDALKSHKCVIDVREHQLKRVQTVFHLCLR